MRRNAESKVRQLLNVPYSLTRCLRVARLGAGAAALILGCCTLLGPETLTAQSVAGKILGVVEDPSRAVVPGATVRVTNLGTNVSQTHVTDPSGYYEFLDLNPGQYSLEVEAHGFKKFLERDLTLRVNQEVRLNVTLETGEVRQVVEVTGQATLLETTTSTIGQVITRKQIVDLPLNGRNPFQLTFLTAGVSGVDGGTGTTGGGFQAGLFGGIISSSTINGGRQGSTEVYMDGAPNTFADNSPGTLGVAYSPSVDSLQEFKVITNNMSAEFGNAGAGVVNIATRSGTNSFHGTAFEFLRNSVLDANNFFSNRAGIPLASFKRNQFGGNFGGPIRRDKTFFFADYEGTRERAAATTTETVPIAAWKNGDFSNFLTGQMTATDCLGRTFDSGQIFNPFSTRAVACGSGYVRDPFPGNIVPQNLMSASALSLLKYWPAPDQPGTSNNFVKSGSVVNTSDQFDVRIDHVISDRQRLMGRFSYDRGYLAPPNFFQNIADPGFNPRPTASRQAVFEHTMNVSSSTLLSGGLSYARNLIATRANGTGFNVTDIGQPQSLNNQIKVHQFPIFGFTDVTGFGGGFVGSRQVAERFSLREMLSHIAGRHSLKFGAQIDLLRTNEGAPAFPSGNYSFGPGFTAGPDPFAPAAVGSDFATLLLGVPNSVISQDVFRAQQSWYYGFFAQDDIKVSRKLTLNVGVRYDLTIPATERHNRATWFDFNAPFPVQIPAANIQALIGGAAAQGITLTNADLANLINLHGGERYAGVNGSRHWFDTDWNNIAPRFGFAYQATDKMVLRGGAGVFYGPSPGAANGTSVAFNIDGFGGFQGGLSTLNGVTPLCHPASVDPARTNCLENPFPNGLNPVPGSSKGLLINFDPAGGVVSMDRHAPSPDIYNWNFGVERTLPGNMLISVAYVGSRALRFATGATAIDQFNQLQRGVSLKFGKPLYTVQVPNPFFGIVKDPNSPISAPTVPLVDALYPYPQFPENPFVTNAPLNGKSSYHALQIRVERQFSNGLSFLSAYTNSKLIDNGEGGLYTIGWHGLEPQDRFNYSLEKALSSQDVSQRFVASFIYELPVGRGKKLDIQNGLGSAVLGGWQVNGIFTLGTGTPVPWGYIPIDPSLGFPYETASRMNEICDPTLGGPVVKRLDSYFNQKCFADPPSFTLGTAPRVDPHLRFPGVSAFDGSMFKNFKITERVSGQFRAEFFNLTNTPRFIASRGSFGPGGFSIFPKALNPSFGVLDSQANDPRKIQFGLKLNF